MLPVFFVYCLLVVVFYFCNFAKNIVIIIIIAKYAGDTEQPFADNDENRAAIVKVSGETEQKYPVTVKKYRTETVRYEVK